MTESIRTDISIPRFEAAVKLANQSKIDGVRDQHLPSAPATTTTSTSHVMTFLGSNGASQTTLKTSEVAKFLGLTEAQLNQKSPSEISKMISKVFLQQFKNVDYGPIRSLSQHQNVINDQILKKNDHTFVKLSSKFDHEGEFPFRLGKGADKTVMVAIETATASPAAFGRIKTDVKVKDQRPLPSIGELDSRIQKEIEIMHELKGHPEFVQILHEFTYAKKDAYRIGILMEYMNSGTIENFPFYNTEYNEQLWGMTDQIVRGIEILDSKGIIHRDLAPKNIFAHVRADDGKFEAKISDFGLIDRRENLLDGEISSMKGSPNIMPPDYMKACQEYEAIEDKNSPEAIALRQKIADPSAHIWQLGMCLFTMRTGGAFPSFVMPFEDESEGEFRERIRDVTQEEVNATVDAAQLDDPLGNLIKSMLSVNGESRPTLQQVKERLAGMDKNAISFYKEQVYEDEQP